MKLSAVEREWVYSKWAQIRASQAKADQANIEWNELNDAFKAKHVAENERRAQRGQFLKSAIMVAEEKSNNLAIQDALATGNWHSRNAERHLLDLQVFLQMKQLELL